jgi:hypothetical protein
MNNAPMSVFAARGRLSLHGERATGANLLVVSFPGGLNSLPIFRSPSFQLSNRHQQAAAKLRQLVFYPWGNGRIHGSGNQAVSLQTLQRERKHPLRDAFDAPSEFAKALLATAEKRHDKHAPLISDTIQNVAYRRTWAVNIAVTRQHQCASLRCVGSHFTLSYRKERFKKRELHKTKE